MRDARDSLGKRTQGSNPPFCAQEAVILYLILFLHVRLRLQMSGVQSLHHCKPLVITLTCVGRSVFTATRSVSAHSLEKSHDQVKLVKRFTLGLRLALASPMFRSRIVRGGVFEAGPGSAALVFSYRSAAPLSSDAFVLLPRTAFSRLVHRLCWSRVSFSDFVFLFSTIVIHFLCCKLLLVSF